MDYRTRVEIDGLRARVNELERESKALRSNAEGFGKASCSAAASLERERDEVRSRVEKLEGDLASALSDHSFEYAACEEQRKRAEAAEKSTEAAEKRVQFLEEALRYIAHHLEHGGLYGPWEELAKQKIETALDVSKALAERQEEASNG